jgi:hypothetical protein
MFIKFFYGIFCGINITPVEIQSNYRFLTTGTSKVPVGLYYSLVVLAWLVGLLHATESSGKLTAKYLSFLF